MFVRDTSKGPGSEGRGEGRERVNSPETILKPPVAQRASDLEHKSDFHKVYKFHGENQNLP